MRLSDTETRALVPLDGQRDAMLARVGQWAAVNSGSANLAGLADMADRLADAFAPLGGAVELVDPAPAEAVASEGERVPLRTGRIVRFVRRPEAARRVLLVGHMDTVYPADSPFRQVTRIDADTLGGPGVADMKGGLTVMLAALAAFEASPFAAALGIEAIVNADEEIGSPGSAPLLAEAARRAVAGLVYEPSQTPEGMLAGSRKGSGNFTATVRGYAAHAGRAPEQGRNAIVAAADLAVRLAALADPSRGLSVNPARIEGGGPNNVVPALAVLRLNIRVADAGQQAEAVDAVAALAAEIAAAHDVAIDLHGGFARPPKPLDAVQEPLFALARDCGGALGLDLAWAPSGGVCDGNNLAAQGLSVVDTLGVRGGAIHSAAEFMLIDSLVERAKLSALILMRLAQQAA